MMTMSKTMRLSCGALVGAALIAACSSSAAPSAPTGTSGVDGGSGSGDPDSAAAADASTTGDPDGSASDGATAPFALTSTAIAEGASFPAANTCSGANVTWPDDQRRTNVSCATSCASSASESMRRHFSRIAGK